MAAQFKANSGEPTSAQAIHALVDTQMSTNKFNQIRIRQQLHQEMYDMNPNASLPYTFLQSLRNSKQDEFYITNLPRQVVNRVAALLGGARRLFRAPDSAHALREKTGDLAASFARSVWAENDLRRSRKAEQPLLPRMAADATLRGWIAGMAVVNVKEVSNNGARPSKKIEWYLEPWEPMATCYDFQGGALSWMAQKRQYERPSVESQGVATQIVQTEFMDREWYCIVSNSGDGVNSWVVKPFRHGGVDAAGNPCVPGWVVPVASQSVQDYGLGGTKNWEGVGNGVLGDIDKLIPHYNAARTDQLRVLPLAFGAPFAVKTERPSGTFSNIRTTERDKVLQLELKESLIPIPNVVDQSANAEFIIGSMADDLHGGSLPSSFLNEPSRGASGYLYAQVNNAAGYLIYPRARAIASAMGIALNHIINQFKTGEYGPAVLFDENPISDNTITDNINPGDLNYAGEVYVKLDVDLGLKDIQTIAQGSQLVAQGQLSLETFLRDYVKVDDVNLEKARIGTEKIEALLPSINYIKSAVYFYEISRPDLGEAMINYAKGQLTNDLLAMTVQKGVGLVQLQQTIAMLSGWNPQAAEALTASMVEIGSQHNEGPDPGTRMLTTQSATGIDNAIIPQEMLAGNKPVPDNSDGQMTRNAQKNTGERDRSNVSS